MKPKDLFALAVRIVGLLSLLYLLSTSVFFFGASLPWFLIVRTIVWLVVSIWMLRGAPQLVRFAYPEGE